MLRTRVTTALLHLLRTVCSVPLVVTAALLAALLVPLTPLTPAHSELSTTPPSPAERLVLLQDALRGAGSATTPRPQSALRWPRPWARPRPHLPVLRPGRPLYLDLEHNEPAQQAAALAHSDPERARVFAHLAEQPVVYWFGDWNPTSELAAQAAARLEAVLAAGAAPVFVVYDVPLRDGGTGYSRGGASSLAAYRAWIDELAAGVGTHRAAFILEPDALNDLYNLEGTRRFERAAALRYAAERLDLHGDVYLDAGGPSIHHPQIMAALLREVGLDHVRGVSLNVANYQTTDDVLSYRRELERLLERPLPAVIDTSRNGAGAIPASEDPEYWCNPPGRQIGALPTTAPGLAGIDAFLWVKRPGSSDGECRGFPPAGTFVPEAAYEMARDAVSG